MRPESPKLLHDILDAAHFILQSVQARSRADFDSDRLLYQAIERNFEIIGEAMNRLNRLDPIVAGRIDAYRQIIAFRNILIHGYDAIDREIVWSVIQNKLPALVSICESLLREPSTQ